MIRETARAFVENDYIDIDFLFVGVMILVVLLVLKYKQIKRLVRRYAPASYGQITILGPILVGFHPIPTKLELKYDKETALSLLAVTIFLYVLVTMVQFFLTLNICGCCRRTEVPKKRKKNKNK